MSNNSSKKLFLVYYGSNEDAMIVDGHAMRRLYIRARYLKEIITVVEIDRAMAKLFCEDAELAELID